MGIVYVLENVVNSKCYVGQTRMPFSKRLSEHKHSESLIGRAIRKYGIASFRFHFSEVPEEFIDNVERNLIIEYRSLSPNGYNLQSGGQKQKCHHNSTKIKISESTRGKTFSKVTRNKLSIAHKGKTISSEQRKKLSIANTGKNISEESKRQISLALKGRSFSEEHKARISLARKGMKFSEATRKKISDCQRGRVFTEDHKHKLSIAHKGKKFTEEHNRKISNARKMYWAAKKAIGK